MLTTEQSETTEQSKEVAPPALSGESRFVGFGQQFTCEFQRRGGKQGRDWLARTGLVIADETGTVVEVNRFLRNLLQRFASQLSSFPGGEASADQVSNLAENVIVEGQAIFRCEGPDNSVNACALVMLFGNFVDSVVAILNEAILPAAKKPENDRVSICSNTLRVYSPPGMARTKIALDGTEVAKDYYAVVSDPCSAEAFADGDTKEIPASMVWALMNAYNVSIPGSPKAAKNVFRSHVRGVAVSFARRLQSEYSLSIETIMAIRPSSWHDLP